MILTGGKSSRFGSDKSQILFEGQALIQRLLGDLPPAEVVIVGPSFEHEARQVSFIQEIPADGGPLAAIAAGLSAITSDEVIILATDMPFAGQMAQYLIPLNGTGEVLIPLDSTRNRQSLCAKYNVTALTRALAELGDLFGKSMYSLLEKLKVEELIVEARLASKLIDIDTREDLIKVLDDFKKNGEEI